MFANDLQTQKLSWLNRHEFHCDLLPQYEIEHRIEMVYVLTLEARKAQGIISLLDEEYKV